MPALRATTVTASYQILGTETPLEWMNEAFSLAKRDGLIEGGEVLTIRSIGGNDFFSVVFTIDVPLDDQQSLADLFSDARAITNAVVQDTDTVVEDVKTRD